MTVGSYAPNDWGLYDAFGNVWEFCLDRWEENISNYGGRINVNLETPGSTISGTATSYHVMRGGGYGSAAGSCRPAHRDGGTSASKVTGFRVTCKAGLQKLPVGMEDGAMCGDEVSALRKALCGAALAAAVLGMAVASPHDCPEQSSPASQSGLICAYSSDVAAAPRLRGVMSPGGDLTEADFQKLEEWGVKLIRFQMCRRNWKGIGGRSRRRSADADHHRVQPEGRPLDIRRHAALHGGVVGDGLGGVREPKRADGGRKRHVPQLQQPGEVFPSERPDAVADVVFENAWPASFRPS